MAEGAGLGGLYLVAGLGESPYPTHREDGFDAGVYYEFPFEHTFMTWFRERLMSRGFAEGPKRYPHRRTLPEPPLHIGGTMIPCVYPNWDNTPRAGRRGVLAMRSTPERFAAHLRRAIELAASAPSGEQVVMIKSWNEWAEGNYLEPDREYGFGRLEAMAAEIRRAKDLSLVPAG
jgi:hypothetical protein